VCPNIWLVTAVTQPLFLLGEFRKILLGNSGKPVTLETLSLTKFLRHVFQKRELTIFGGLEPAKPQIREYVKFGDRDSVKTWSREHAEARNLELAVARTSKGG
jgi:hypothetical protein